MGLRRVLAYITAPGIGLAAGYVAVSGYLANVMSRVRPVPIEATPSDEGMDYEEVVFPARGEKLLIRGWLIDGREESPYLIMVHGASRHRADKSINTLGLARAMRDNGYSVLMFDLRGHGESDGRRVSAGHREQRDLLGAVDYLERRGVSPSRMAFIGFSLGAVVSLISARQAGVRSVVADSAFCDLREVIRQRSGGSKRLSILMPGMLLMSRLLYGMNIKRVRPIQALQELDFPVLLIHGEADVLVPPSHSERLAQATMHEGSQLWMVPGVGHVRAFVTYPQEYAQRVVQYLSKTLGPAADEIHDMVAPV